MHRIAASLLVASLAACAGEDATERAAYLTLMGDDTLAIEWMEFGDDEVHAQALVRGSETTFSDYHLAFDEQGRVVQFHARTWEGGDTMGAPMRTQELRMPEGGTAQIVTVMADGEERPRDLDEVPPSAVPFIDMLHWPFEASMRWQMDEMGALQTEVPILGGRPFPLSENADGSWALRHPSRGPSTMRVDEVGRITMLDGTGSTRAYDLSRVPFDQLDPMAMLDRFGERPLGELSGRGEIDDEVRGVYFSGHYGEPLKRGRDIFGGLLAYGVWWRTGANAATHLSIDGDIVIDGEVIPAGDYTLSSIPEEDGGVLIINRQTGQGGQSYDESMDQARVQMRRDMLDETVEAFEIRAVETDEGGRLELRWDDTVYWVPFTVR
ncbi:MAG: DUF2911 domain-containing protein [Longimicrobiales bacterium]